MSDIEANKAKVREFYDRSHAGDLAVYDEMLAPGFVNYGGPAGELHGPEAFKQAYVGFAAAMSDFRTSIDLMVAEGDLVCVRQRWSGTHVGEFLGQPATGREVSFTSTAILEIRDGQIAAAWVDLDAAGLIQQLTG